MKARRFNSLKAGERFVHMGREYRVIEPLTVRGLHDERFRYNAVDLVSSSSHSGWLRWFPPQTKVQPPESGW